MLHVVSAARKQISIFKLLARRSNRFFIVNAKLLRHLCSPSSDRPLSTLVLTSSLNIPYQTVLNLTPHFYKSFYFLLSN